MNTISVTEPRMAVRSDVEKNHVVLKGASRVTPVTLTADSYQLGPSVPTNASWNVTPPSNQTVVDRFVRVRYYLDITSTGGNFVPYSKDALRQFPASSIIDVTSVSINGETVSDNTKRKLHAMLCFGNTAEDRSKSWSTTAAQPDSYQKYNDWAQPYGGSARNPLAAWGECSAEPSRGGYEYVSSTATNVRVIVTEPLFISPFYQGLGSQEEGFVNVNDLSINLRFASNVGRAWSHDISSAMTSVSCTFYKAPELLVNYLTPDLLQPIPELQLLPYQKANEYIRSMSDIPVGGEVTVFSDTIRLSQIPRKIYLWARRSDASESFITSDSFPSIERVSVSWGNQSGLLASAGKEELFEISRRNGCNLDFPSWSKKRGSVLCLEMGKDIGLLDSEAPGLQGSYNIQVEIVFKNQDTSIYLKPEFVMCTCSDGVFSIGPNTARASLGNLTQQQILQAHSSGEMEMHHMSYAELEGGSFWSSLKNIVHKVATVASPIVSAVAPEFSGIVEGVKQLSGGARQGMSGGRLSGGSIRRR
jgi:hypothetical protein